MSWKGGRSRRENESISLFIARSKTSSTNRNIFVLRFLHSLSASVPFSSRERERDATSQPKRKRGKEEQGNQHREGHQVRNQEAGKEEADVRPRVVLFWTSSSVLCGRHDTAQDATGRAAQSSGSNEWKRVVFSSRSAQRTRKEQDDDKEREGSDLVVVHQTAS